jgi:uncharacterized protein with HEPN domain
MRKCLSDKARLHHIYDAIAAIESYVLQSDYNVFQKNSMMQFACVKQLEIIGEAANQLTANFIKNHSEILWREIIDLRNLLIHEYFGIDTKIVWDIIKIDIVSLKHHIKDILEHI